MEELINGFPREFYKLEKDGFTLTPKSDLELFNEGLISQEEYNKSVDAKRQQSYQNETDNLLLDFMSSYLENRKDTLTKTELELWKVIEDKKQAIKTEYPKQS